MKPTSTIIGAVHQQPNHDSALKHVSGEAAYIDDLPAPRDLQEAVLVLSPHPHARIVSINYSKALIMPGVSGVVTADDIKGQNDIAPVFSGEPLLAETLVEYAGQPIAAVSADTYDQALAASKKIEIEFEVLRPVLSIEEAWEKKRFTFDPLEITFGRPLEAIAEAPKVLEGDVSCGGQDHFYLETQISMAVPGEDQDLTVYSSTQHPTEAQKGISRVLDIPQHCVLIEVRRMGGAFGGKESQSTIIAALSALLARKVKKPVKLRLRRDQDMLMTGKRHDFLIKYQVGFSQNGRILGLVVDLAMRSGNVADLSSGVLTRAMCHVDNAYFLENALIRGWPCKTNTVSNTAFRGFGGPQGMLAIETVLEHIAWDLKKDIGVVREANWYRKTIRNKTPYQQLVKDNILPRLVAELSQKADLANRQLEIDRYNKKNRILKKGIALMPVKFGISFNAPLLNQAGALVHVYTDGTVQVNHGGTEMGQGLFTKVAQVVCSVFQIDIRNIRVSATRTDKVPNTTPTAASVGSDLNGMAALKATQKIKKRMTDSVAKHFRVRSSDIEFRNNRVYAGNGSVSFSEAAQITWNARESLSATGYYKTPKIHWDPKTMTGSPFYYFTYGACLSEVAINSLTGESRTLRVDILQDTGNSLNPSIDRGQIEGGFLQGAGWLTMEELVWDTKGTLLTKGPSTYKIPGSRDIPPELYVHTLVNKPNTVPTIFRSKAIGEPPLMLAISVWLAIRDAVSRAGNYACYPRLSAPATPEAVLNSLKKIKM
ncbi:MAG: xanthine dehydrogenase molybdopterin binding subunit [Alphaproteobacteria bacterium]